MNRQTDQQLLQDYAGRRSEPAFAELVHRYVDLVYSAALRMVCDPHLAQDVTQSVFVALAKSAPQLAHCRVLSGWLHHTAQNLAANVVRSEVRRRQREQEAAAMNELLSTQSETSWTAIAPDLDAALGELDAADRDALLLRYFEKKSAAEIAGILGISNEAAQKRVSRAVERLREFFSKRKVTVGAGGLVALISANAVQSAPAGLAVAISTAALAGTLTTTTFIATTKVIAMTTLQKSLITATITVLAGTGVYQARQAALLREQNHTLQQQQTALAGQVQQLQQARDGAIGRLASLDTQTPLIGTNETELLQLRGEVSVLRQQLASQRTAAPDPAQASSATVASPNEDAAKLVTAIEQGDTTAFPKLEKYAAARLDVYRTNGLDLTGDEQAVAWTTAFGGLNSAFGTLADAAIHGNLNAQAAIKQGARDNQLQGFAVDSLGKLAGAGDTEALGMLLNPNQYGILLSDTVGALQPAADHGNQQAIAALVAVVNDESKKPLWFLASQSLQKAAMSGDASAIAALKSMTQQE